MHALTCCAPLLLLLLPLAAQARVAPLVGTVLAPDGSPVKDASVVVSRCDCRGSLCLEVGLLDEWVEVTRARTDKAGRFGLQMPIGLDVRVDVEHPAYAQWRDETIVPDGDVTLRLQPPCSVKGRLVDRATGKGTPGTLKAWSDTCGDLFSGRTDQEGRFAFDRVPAGPFRCWVEPDVARTPDEPIAHVVGGGEPSEFIVELDAGVTLTGSVTDAETLKPIAGAIVREGSRKPVRTDVEGVYTLRGCRGGDVPNLYCAVPGYARLHSQQYVGGERTRVSFALSRGASVVGRVVDGAGNGLTDVYVAVIADGPGMSWVAWQPARSAADGSFVCEGLPRDIDGVLIVRCAGYASLAYFLPRPARDGRIDVGAVALAAPGVVCGSARDADGKPLAGADVCLRGMNADAARLAPEPPNGESLRLYAGVRWRRTSMNGAFAFGDVAPGTYEIWVAGAPDMVTGSPQRIDVTAARDPTPVRLVR